MSEKDNSILTDPNHHVQLYESEAYLTEVVTQFAGAGLNAGEPVVLITTPEHRQNFSTALHSKGVDPHRHARLGRLVFLDARHTLSTFMLNGVPDRGYFRKHMGDVIEGARAGRSHARVRAFGDMVDLLWRDGNSEAAIRLEELWNELAQTHYFSLLCAYSMGNFAGEGHARNFRNICRQHASVTPTERYMKAADEPAKRHEISLLEQRARSLESEIERRKTLEAELRELIAREQTARIEVEKASRVKDDFLAVLSHELRTPLTAVLGWIQLMESRNDPQTVARALEVMRRNAKLQLNLINDLLDVSRIMSGKMVIKKERVDLGRIAVASLDTVRPSALAKSIEIEIFMKEPAPFVLGDADRLQQVLWNLLTNAIKFTPRGGKIELHLECDDSQADIVVCDTGVGIAEDFLPHVFDRFRQGDCGTDRKASGLGLGLALVRYIVEAHGGTVSATSGGPGSGATFRVRIPISVPGESYLPMPKSIATKNLQGFRLLIVDDEPDTCDLFKFVLEEAGAEVDVASSVDQAMSCLTSKPIDLLLADIGMPLTDGFSMIVAIRSHSSPQVRGVRAIAVTSYAGEQFRTRAFSSGFDDFITKPVQPADLVNLVGQYLGGCKAPAA